ncbi:unnamed protein product [Schistosoma mattheei]|uniref:Uncharacterized protein n=1 Tax=Schistosoma mattheei TaxID=31246 RepID=A0A183Q3C8_9TREM|nr:unnamed protein product [Schistosoma mattheei]
MVEPTGTYVPANIAWLGHHDRQARPPRQGSSFDGCTNEQFYNELKYWPNSPIFQRVYDSRDLIFWVRLRMNEGSKTPDVAGADKRPVGYIIKSGYPTADRNEVEEREVWGTDPWSGIGIR